MQVDVIAVLVGAGPWVAGGLLGLAVLVVPVIFALALRRGHAEGREVSADASVLRVIRFGVKLGAPTNHRPGHPGRSEINGRPDPAGIDPSG